MTLLFWDVDTQVDFIEPGGRLSVPGAAQIRPTLKRLTDFAHQSGIRILASAGNHPAGSPDRRKIPETGLRNPLRVEADHHDETGLSRRASEHEGDLLVQSPGPDVFANPNVLPILRALDCKVIVLYGVATDVSVKYAIEGLALHRPHTRIYFVSDATRAMNHDVAEHLLKEWAEEGVRLVKAEEILEGGVLEPYLTA